MWFDSSSRFGGYITFWCSKRSESHTSSVAVLNRTDSFGSSILCRYVIWFVARFTNRRFYCASIPLWVDWFGFDFVIWFTLWVELKVDYASIARCQVVERERERERGKEILWCIRINYSNVRINNSHLIILWFICLGVWRIGNSVQ